MWYSRSRRRRAASSSLSVSFCCLYSQSSLSAGMSSLLTCMSCPAPAAPHLNIQIYLAFFSPFFFTCTIPKIDKKKHLICAMSILPTSPCCFSVYICRLFYRHETKETVLKQSFFIFLRLCLPPSQTEHCLWQPAAVTPPELQPFVRHLLCGLTDYLTFAQLQQQSSGP